MHTVKLKIEEEKDLYDPFDPDGESLSGDVKAYIVDRIPERKLGDDVELQIIAAEPLDRERLKRAFCRWYDVEERKLKSEYRKNLVQQLHMFAVCVCFIAVSLALESKVGVVWFTVLSTIGAFSMWEAASIWIIQNPRLRLRKRIVGKLKDNISISVESAQ